MKKTIPLTLFSIFILSYSPTVNANLISNGDFEDLTADYNGALFYLGTNDTGEWYDLNWATASGGPPGSTLYFDHTAGGGKDQAAFQPVDATTTPAGSELTLSFDYVFGPGASEDEFEVGIIGMTGSGARYEAFGGAGLDGTFNSPLTDRMILGSLDLSSGWGTGSLTVTTNQKYDVFIVAFRTGFTGPENLGTRSIDNVSLTSTFSVPEPATMLLLGTGLAGLAGAGIRKKKK